MEITEQVRALFDQHPALKPPNLLDVQTLDHVVYLNGVVDTDLERQMAESVAHEAKGVTKVGVIVKHGLRNALIPIVTMAGLQTGFLLGGAVLTESIFAWPGVGRLAFEAISNRDYPLIIGSVLLFAAIFVLVNFIVDILYALLNPRIRYA